MGLPLDPDAAPRPEKWMAGRRKATVWPMALTTFCTTCQRTVYIAEDDTNVCPVCSSPLLATVEVGEEGNDEGGPPESP
jgi:hypothetical protein